MEGLLYMFAQHRVRVSAHGEVDGELMRTEGGGRGDPGQLVKSVAFWIAGGWDFPRTLPPVADLWGILQLSG